MDCLKHCLWYFFFQHVILFIKEEDFGQDGEVDEEDEDEDEDEDGMQHHKIPIFTL